jgi:hypothetical protein
MTIDLPYATGIALIVGLTIVSIVFIIAKAVVAVKRK